MTNNWPPPSPQQPTQPSWAPPEAMPGPGSWPPPQANTAQPGWPPHGTAAPWGGAPTTTGEDRLLQWAVPINRSGLAIAAGYVGLFGLVIVVLGPVAALLGILALRDLKRHPGKLGRGRAWFAIISGAWGTAAVVFVAVNYLDFYARNY